MTIKDLVKDGNTVEFSHYRAQHMYYHIQFEGDTYEFVVSLEDIGSATTGRTEKAISYMRWIRKAMANNTFNKV